MTKKERAKYISEYLNKLYPNPDIPLQHHSTYELLIAVVLSAQCTDQRVNLVTPALFERANTPEQMAGLEVADIENIIRSCGLSKSKSRNISALSKIICTHHGGSVPNDWDKLEQLPGVGHKTASVVKSQGFGEPAFPVDTHIHRLSQRWKLSSGKNVQQTEKDLKILFPKSDWNRLHLQIIYYGREYCPARGHHIENCPICQHLTP